LVRHLLTVEVSKRLDDVSKMLDVISVVTESAEKLPKFPFSLRA